MSFKNIFITITLIIISICYLPGLPPYADFKILEDTILIPLQGPLAPNDFLDYGERLYENYLIQPESVAIRKVNEIYTGVRGGNIVKIWGKNLENSQLIPYHDNACGEPFDDFKCGRPLAVRFHKDGLLYIADPYLGLFSLNVDNGNSKHIFGVNEKIEGKRPRLLDDFDFDHDGNIYWSDASTVAELTDGAIEIHSSASGRLVMFNPSTKNQTVILDKLHFANGVQLSPNKDFVLVNETPRQRTIRYWLKGPKMGNSEVFVLLPGMIDNIRARPEGGYFIALIAVEDEYSHKIQDFFNKKPTLRKFICRLYGITQIVARYINKIFPNEFCQLLDYEIFSLHNLGQWFDNGLSMVVEVDESGKIIGSLHGKTRQIYRSSHVEKIGDNYFFGSPFVNYLGRLNVKNMKPKPQELKPNKAAKDEL